MATDVIAYVAVSLDGYLAEADGGVRFLDDFGSDEYDFNGFMANIGAVVMGSTTYEQVLEWGWPYGDLPGLVLTSRELPIAEGADIEFSSAPTGDAIASFAERTDKRLWIVGGGHVILAGLEAGAVDILEIYVMPVALGAGVPLFPRAYAGPLQVVESQAFTNGVIRAVYRVG